MISTIPPNTSQVLLSEEFDGDSVKLLPTEVSILGQFGIDTSFVNGHRFEQLLGEQPQLEQTAFKDFWLSVKHRQYRLFELALHSHLLFLENLFPGKSHVQTMEVLLRFLKMLTKQPEWFVRIMNISGGGEMNSWMERIAVDVWTDVIPQLFSYLNHSNSIVRSIISLLLDTIGLHIPHAICYQAIVIAEQLDEFDIFMNIKRKQSTIKTLD
uniref:FAT domain-containing protein n=1 Tax=Meloidogyne javanica TaxID=6303 RepID=A0A915LKU2_MELJA